MLLNQRVREQLVNRKKNDLDLWVIIRHHKYIKVGVGTGFYQT